MPFQLLDLILIGIMIISGLLALMRGFTREVLSLVAWGVAALAALGSILSPELLGIAQQYLQPEIVAKIALAGGVFLIVLIIMSLISVRICRLGARQRRRGIRQIVGVCLRRGARTAARGHRLSVLHLARTEGET